MGAMSKLITTLVIKVKILTVNFSRVFNAIDSVLRRGMNVPLDHGVGSIGSHKSSRRSCRSKLDSVPVILQLSGRRWKGNGRVRPVIFHNALNGDIEVNR